jgi:hypothetical protein
MWLKKQGYLQSSSLFRAALRRETLVRELLGEAYWATIQRPVFSHNVVWQSGIADRQSLFR